MYSINQNMMNHNIIVLIHVIMFGTNLIRMEKLLMFAQNIKTVKISMIINISDKIISGNVYKAVVMMYGVTLMEITFVENHNHVMKTNILSKIRNNVYNNVQLITKATHVFHNVQMDIIYKKVQMFVVTLAHIINQIIVIRQYVYQVIHAQKHIMNLIKMVINV